MRIYRPGTPELRTVLRRYYRERDRVDAEVEKIMAAHNGKPPVGMQGGKLVLIASPVLPEYPPYPEECRCMTCGATTRKGTPCRLTSIYRNGRCKFHGGLSTGPRTKKGKKRSARNGLRPKRNTNGLKQVRPHVLWTGRSEPHGMMVNP